MGDLKNSQEIKRDDEEKSVINQPLNEKDLELVSGGTNVDDKKIENINSSSADSDDSGKKYKSQLESKLKTAKGYIDDANKILDFFGV